MHLWYDEQQSKIPDKPTDFEWNISNAFLKMKGEDKRRQWIPIVWQQPCEFPMEPMLTMWKGCLRDSSHNDIFKANITFYHKPKFTVS